MEAYESIIATLALTLGASWASGINLYAVLLVLGLGGATGHVDLPPGLDALQNPLVIGAALLMYGVEFFADKVPGVDTAWDTLHTFVRLPAGAILAANAVGDVSPVMELAAAIAGGGMAATSHATKAGSRLLINSSPEPVSNWGASLLEDVVVIGGLWAALQHPVVFLVLLLGFLVLAVWLLPKLWRAIVYILKKIGSFFGMDATNNKSFYSNDFSPSGFNDSGFNAGVIGRFAAAKQPSDIASELERLAALKSSGAITDAEYKEAKRRLLDE